MEKKPESPPIPSSLRENYLSYIFSTMTDNEDFLYENARAFYDELVVFTNDAIDYISTAIKRSTRLE